MTTTKLHLTRHIKETALSGSQSLRLRADPPATHAPKTLNTLSIASVSKCLWYSKPELKISFLIEYLAHHGREYVLM